MKELSEQLLCVEVFGVLAEEPRTSEEMTNKTYKNMYAKNIVRVYQTVEILLKRGIIVPMFSNREIKYKLDEKILGGRNNGTVL